MRVFLPIVITLLMAAVSFAAEPTTKPDLPPLIVGASPRKSFVVDGVLRFSATTGLAFHVATDGTREMTALYDAIDGTPLFISDGHRSLIYDLAEERLLFAPV